MTRINLIPPSELTNKHLLAEYRELPRVFTLAKKAWLRGEFRTDFPQQYTMGKGHVKFFYCKLGWLKKRHHLLVGEMTKRGFKVSYPRPKSTGYLPDSWHQDWEPQERDIQINRQRIFERLSKI